MIGRLSVLAGAALLAVAASTPPVDQPLSLEVQGLRSAKGNILICITRAARYFPDCSGDPDKRHLVIPARAQAIPLGVLPPGDYAIAIIHDENGNGKLDTFVGIPREGVGFSRNPVIRFGAPGYNAAHFTIGTAPVRQMIKMKYFL